MPDAKKIQTYEHLLDALRNVMADFTEGRDEWESLRCFRDALIEIRQEASERVEEINDRREEDSEE